MENKGQITIRIEGSYGSVPLTPENYDITLMQSVLGYAIALLDLDKRKETPVTTFHVENGSVKNIFTTSKQKAVEFASVLALVISSSSIDQLDPKTAVAFEDVQKFSIQNNFNVDISTSESKDHIVHITPTTYLRRTEHLWADAEVYYYGTLVDAGGKRKANIHLDTKDGLIMIDTDKDILTNIQGNPLYRRFGVRAKAKQNIVTGAIDTSSLKLIEILEYEPKFDLAYLERKIEASTPIWSNVDVDDYLNSIRGGEYGNK
jgi:hypothetical protein